MQAALRDHAARAGRPGTASRRQQQQQAHVQHQANIMGLIWIGMQETLLLSTKWTGMQQALAAERPLASHKSEVARAVQSVCASSLQVFFYLRLRLSVAPRSLRICKLMLYLAPAVAICC